MAPLEPPLDHSSVFTVCTFTNDYLINYPRYRQKISRTVFGSVPGTLQLSVPGSVQTIRPNMAARTLKCSENAQNVSNFSTGLITIAVQSATKRTEVHRVCFTGTPVEWLR